MIPTVTDITFATAVWANQVAADVNSLLAGSPGAPAAIIELATTPVGASVGSLAWSTVHSALMRWTGTQWVYAEGVPNHFAYDDLIVLTGFSTSSGMGGGTQAVITETPPHYGLVRNASTAVANSGFKTQIGQSIGGSAGVRMRCVFSLPTVAANSRQVIGFHDQTVGATPPVDGAYLDVNAGLASFKTTAASVGSTHATTATLVASTFYTLHVIYTAVSTARLLLIKDDGTVVLDLSTSSNVPNGLTNRFQAAAAGFNTTAAAVNLLDVDWIGVGVAPA